MNSNMNQIKINTLAIKKLIEKNDPNEEFSWLNDVYRYAEDIETELDYIENNIQNVIDAVKDLE